MTFSSKNIIQLYFIRYVSSLRLVKSPFYIFFNNDIVIAESYTIEYNFQCNTNTSAMNWRSLL